MAEKEQAKLDLQSQTFYMFLKLKLWRESLSVKNTSDPELTSVEDLVDFQFLEARDLSIDFHEGTSIEAPSSSPAPLE